MNISDFRAGTLQKGYRYKYFLPEKINHSFFWTDEGINELLERAFLAEETGNNAMIATTSLPYRELCTHYVQNFSK